MAGKDKLRDEDEAEADGEEKAAKGGKKPGVMKLVILGAVAVFVAVLGAQVAAPLLTKMISGDGHAAEAAADGEEAADEEGAAEDGDIELAEAETPEAPAIYTPLDPPFVVSFSDADGDNRFLQLTLQAMARNEHAIDEVKRHSPAIRNAFLFLISAYKVEDLATLEGKEKLRAEMLAAANEIMERNTGEPSIEELYFTSLVIQ
jgi:flagellar protein FliL